MGHIVLIERSGEAKSLLKPIASLSPVRWIEDCRELSGALKGARAIVVSHLSGPALDSFSGLLTQENVPIFSLIGPFQDKIRNAIHFSEVSTLLEALVDALGQDTNTTHAFVSWKGAKLDLIGGKISKDEEHELLTQKEVTLLAYLMECGGETIDRHSVKKMVWCGVKVSDSSLESLICRLRKKVEKLELSIESVYGGGYRLI